MAFDLSTTKEYAKKHWPVIVGGLVGLLVLYYLYKNYSGGKTSTAPTDLSGAATGLQQLSAAAQLTNAQTNAQVETSQIQGQVASQQVAAQLQATEVTTAAQLAATEQQTSAAETVALTVPTQIQQTISDQAVAQTQIQANTLDTLAVTAGNNQVALQNARNQVAFQSIGVVKNLLALTPTEKDQGPFLNAVAPIALALTGQGAPAATAVQANNALAIANTQAGVAQTQAVVGGVSSVLTGLFG